MQEQLSLLGNIVVSAAYAAITVAIVVPVVQARQLRTNRLATATALIFLSCSVGHGFHALMAWEALTAGGPAGRTHTMPSGWSWPSAVWDALTASIGVYYWTLRRGYRVLLGKGALYVDPGIQRRLGEVEARERDAMSQAERHRASLAVVVEYSDDAIIGTTLHGVVTAWNGGAERLFGYTADEAVGRPASMLTGPTGDADQSDILTRISAGERGIRYESRRLHKDGSEIDISVTVSPIQDVGGAVVGLSAVARDVTAATRLAAQRRVLEERSQQAQRMESLGQLAGGVAHDFNNLLAIIVNFTAFAVEQSAGNAGVEADLTQVRLAADRAAGLTRQLLTFTRGDAVQPQNIDLNASIAEVQAMLTRTIGEHIELVAGPAPGPLMVFADPGQLQQVLVNLALNARDAMPDGGILTIEATATDLDENQVNLQPSPRAGRYVRLSVSDTGAGMTAEVVRHIFEPFFTTKPRGQGTGLGLATVYGIVAEAGGSINVYSEPGVGTTFRLYLPLVSVLGTPPAPVDVRSAGGHGRTVLVVEDEPALGAVVARILTAGGYQVLSASGGPQALAIAAEQHCDLLLTDVIMPEMSGRRLAELLQERHPKLPVLYMSGYSNGLLGTTHVLDQGIAFIEKPFTADHLLMEVDSMFVGTPTTAA